MNPIYEETLLYDFYGELLTDIQKEVFEDTVLNDYSLAEVAEDRGITRQGVYDNLKRTKEILREYERKLGLVAKFLSIREELEKIKEITDDRAVLEIADRITEKL